MRYISRSALELLICAGAERLSPIHCLMPANRRTALPFPEPVKELKLRFAEHVTPLVMRMLQPSGDIVRLTDVTASGTVVVVRLTAGDQHGTTSSGA